MIVGKDIEWTDQCSRVTEIATESMRKLNVSFNVWMLRSLKKITSICKVTFGELCTSLVFLLAWRYR